MRSTSDRLSTRTAAAVLSGLLAFTSAAPAFAQGKKPAAAAPAKPAGAKPTAAKPAKDAAAKPKKKLSEKEAKKEALAHYKAGEAKFGKGDYAGALEDFKTADELVPGAAPKYWAALTLDKMNKAPDAVAAYQTFLDSKPDAEKFKDKITEATSRIDALKKTPAKVKVATDPAQAPNLKLAVDGAAQPGPELSVAPGHHTITAKADGLEGSQDVDVTFAEQKDVTIKLSQAAPPPVAAATPPPKTTPPPAQSATPAATPPATAPVAEHRSNIPAYVTLGLAVVGAGVGTVFGIQALGSKSDYNANPTRDGLDKVERQSLLADMSYAVALTFGVTGVVLLLSNTGSKSQQVGTTKTASTTKGFVAAPYVTPQGGGAAATLRF